MSGKDVVVRVLDGEDTIGGSKILVGWGGEGVFLDFGINYAKFGRYFEEYVKPRSPLGLGDLWKLGLIPRFEGLYRGDAVPPGLEAGPDLPVRRITGVYVSHAHLDHAGLIGLLDERIPLICSRTTAAILKAVQDYGKSDIFQQSVYMNRLKRETREGRTLLRADAAAPYVGRDCYLTDGAGSEAFARFWREPPTRVDPARPKRGRGPKGLDAGALRTLQPSSGGPHAAAFTVDHSVLGSSGFILESPNGPIAYSGDIRTHGEHAAGTRAFFNHLSHHKPYILLIEGTQIKEHDVPEEALGGPTPESEVEAKCLAAVEAYRGKLVVADFAPRNIERLKAFDRIARRTGRRLVILPKDAYLLHAMHAADSDVPLPHEGLLVFLPPTAKEDGWERFILEAYPGHTVDSRDVRAAPGAYVLCLSYWDIKHLLDVEPDGGAYIYSSSEAFSEEQEIDMERLHHWLVRFHLDPVGFRMIPVEGKRRRLAPQFVPGYHSSGHMPGDEILTWIEQVQPDYVLPLHTDRPEVYRRKLEERGLKTLAGGLG